MDAPKKWLISLFHLAVDLFVMANVFTSFLSLDPDIHNSWNLIVIPLACLGLDFLCGMIMATKFHLVQARVWPVLAVTSPILLLLIYITIKDGFVGLSIISDVKLLILYAERYFVKRLFSRRFQNE